MTFREIGSLYSAVWFWIQYYNFELRVRHHRVERGTLSRFAPGGVVWERTPLLRTAIDEGPRLSHEGPDVRARRQVCGVYYRRARLVNIECIALRVPAFHQERETMCFAHVKPRGGVNQRIWSCSDERNDGGELCADGAEFGRPFNSDLHGFETSGTCAPHGPTVADGEGSALQKRGAKERRKPLFSPFTDHLRIDVDSVAVGIVVMFGKERRLRDVKVARLVGDVLGRPCEVEASSEGVRERDYRHGGSRTVDRLERVSNADV